MAVPVTIEVQLVLVFIYCCVNFKFEIFGTRIMKSILLVNLLKDIMSMCFP
jgi:hypothetical protein